MNITYSRAILYVNDSALETEVKFDPTYRLGDADKSYFQIEGVGEYTSVRVDHIPQLIQWLQAIQSLDQEHRAKRA